ncbi:outer membrane lipoprotein chaperone LolA [Variovorax sp. VNK109]|uniref:outer membrane lipoprotein chaperone LolA n=1 Tax=Variovorax sp. VNK109 TaxID=3400919 RepID=UPI003BFD1678
MKTAAGYLSFFTVALALGVASSPARANGLDVLEEFLRSAKTGRAEFTQVVTAPVKDGQTARTKTSSGTFEFQRPGRFRFAYSKPFAQVIVADGKTLWLHDVDLNQVTVRQQAQALGATPAAILASASSIQALQADFTLTAAPDAEGLQWATATPKAKDGQVQSVKVGFRGKELAALDILDSFGQRSRLTFSKVELNPQLPAGAFDFKTPTGADVLRQ